MKYNKGTIMLRSCSFLKIMLYYDKVINQKNDDKGENRNKKIKFKEKKFYEKVCKLEELIALILVAGIAVLVFVSALMRTVGHPLNWAQDVALIAFAWLIFLGSDVAMRGSGLIGVDLFVKKFPAGVQKVLDILFKVIIAAFLCVLIYYGYGMTTTGWARQITSLHISYSWVTMAVPVGSFFMLISTILNIIERVKTPAGQEVKHEAGRDVG